MRTLSLQPYLDTLDPEARERVTRSLERTARGYDQDLTTPLIPDKSNPTPGREQRIAEFDSFCLPSQFPWLDEDEITQREKIGPYSIMLPYAERRQSVEKFFDVRDTSIHTDSADYATYELSKLVSSTLHATDLDSAYNRMPRGTNLGLPFATADQDYRRMVLELARFIGRTGYNAEPDPSMLFWRGQPKGLLELPKQRNICGIPHYVILWELTIQESFTRYAVKNPEFSAWVNDDAVAEAISMVFEVAEHDILSVDFSGFDTSVPSSIIRLVFDVIRSWFSTHSRSVIDYVERIFLEIPILTPTGILTGRDGGVPSGMGTTNMVDTLVQKWIMHYVAHRMHNEVVVHMAQGDDGVVVFRRPWRIDDVVDIAHELNMDISSSKGGVSKDVIHYLQNVHHRGHKIGGLCVGVRPAYRVLNGMLSYERFHKGWKGADDSFRWQQQVDNARWHPKFKEIVQFLWDNDAYVREYTNQQLMKKAGGRAAVESALGQAAFPYGKTPVSKLDRSAVGRALERLRRGEGSGDGRASMFLV
jgi:hypothetical protein